MSGDQQQKKLPPDLVTLDEVIAVVGGRLIWLSDVEAEFDAIVSGQESSGALLSDRDKQFLRNRILRNKVQNHTLAHGAMTLGFATPEQVESLVQEYAREEEEDLIRQFGSIGGVVEELGHQDQTWASYQNDKRETNLTNLAWNRSVALRLNNQLTLFPTKKSMREYYAQHVETWVHGPVATLDVVAFLPTRINGNGNGASLEERADGASRAWNDGLSAEEVAERFGGVPARGTWEFGPDLADARAPFYRQFALGNPEGTVSRPIPHNDRLGPAGEEPDGGPQPPVREPLGTAIHPAGAGGRGGGESPPGDDSPQQEPNLYLAGVAPGTLRDSRTSSQESISALLFPTPVNRREPSPFPPRAEDPGIPRRLRWPPPPLISTELL